MKFTYNYESWQREFIVLQSARYTEDLHQNRPILIRDLPVFGKVVYLKIPRRQFYCSRMSTLFH